LAAFVLFLACIVGGLPIAASAQGVNAGANAVYNYAATTTIPSTSFVDANQFTGSSSTDVCGKINAVLTWANYPASGTVIDARGIVPAMNTRNYTCSMNPFSGVSSPSVVLLPSGTIKTAFTWILPANTRLIGVGPSGITPPGTTIQAMSGLASTIIQLATASASAESVSVENLTLEGMSMAVSGIVNVYAEEHSYVRNVTFINFLGAAGGAAPALLIGSTPGTQAGQNSGPYEDLYFVNTEGGCVTLNSKNTRGIHQMTCIGNVSTYQAGVYLDGPANRIEDTHFEGFADGILVGSQSGSAAFGDVISNADGNSNSLNGPMTNVIHIENNGVVDLAITGVRADEFGSTAPNSIRDDETSTTLSDSTVALYVLGEAKAGGRSRFTTSPNAPAWVVGNVAPSGSCAPASIGSLYSNTGAGSPSTTLYVCVPGSLGGVWLALTIP